MDSFKTANMETRLRAQLECILTPLGVMFEKETLADCMADETIRQFYGKTLQKELMDTLDKDGRDQAIIETCRYLSYKPVSPACDALLDGLISDYGLLLIPLMNEQTPHLIMAFAALIMLFAGVRKKENGYELIGSQGEQVLLVRDQEKLQAFSRLSCDMDCETLAYAVLSDTTLWDKDLRAKGEQVEEMLCDALRTIQLCGLKQALEGEKK